MIEITQNLFTVWEIKSVVEFNELQDDLNCFGFIRGTEARVVRSSENTSNALVCEVRADGIQGVVAAPLEFFLFRE